MVFAAANVALALQESGGGTRQNHSDELPEEITAWLHIGEDGKVTAFTGKVEMGQNIRTSLAQSVADELRVPFDKRTMVMGDTPLTPFDVGTFGSRTTPTMAPQLRRVASAARDLLLQTAAKEWNIAPEKLVAANAKSRIQLRGGPLATVNSRTEKRSHKNFPMRTRSRRHPNGRSPANRCRK